MSTNPPTLTREQWRTVLVEERDVLVLQYFLDLIWVRMGNTYASVGALRSMEQNNATMDVTLTEYLSAARNTDDSIDGAAKITHIQNGNGVWQVDEGEQLEEDPDEYRVECSCGESFGFCGLAINHVEEEH